MVKRLTLLIIAPRYVGYPTFVSRFIFVGVSGKIAVLFDRFSNQTSDAGAYGFFVSAHC